MKIIESLKVKHSEQLEEFVIEEFTKAGSAQNQYKLLKQFSAAQAAIEHESDPRGRSSVNFGAAISQIAIRLSQRIDQYGEKAHPLAEWEIKKIVTALEATRREWNFIFSQSTRPARPNTGDIVIARNIRTESFQVATIIQVDDDGFGPWYTVEWGDVIIGSPNHDTHVGPDHIFYPLTAQPFVKSIK